ncbi:TetR/AcrR family transcriptional regulator [Promicromonospora sp. Marseille-Q5078]
MPVTAELRPARADDAEDVARIWREGWADAHLGHVPEALVAARTPASFAARARRARPPPAANLDTPVQPWRFPVATTPTTPGTTSTTGVTDRAQGGTKDRTKRADAVRNIEAIVGAAIRLLSVDPDASINEIAKAAGVGRVTLYGHFDSRATLVREVADRAIAQTDESLGQVDLEGDPREALGRLLEATWHLTHRFGALVVAASQALPPEEMRRAHEEPAARVRGLLERGRAAGDFRDDMPIAWQLSVVQAVVHGASLAVHRGEISADQAPSLVRDTTLAALTA